MAGPYGLGENKMLCGVCREPATYVRDLDLMFHNDGSDNRECHRQILRHEVTPAYIPTSLTDFILAETCSTCKAPPLFDCRAPTKQVSYFPRRERQHIKRQNAGRFEYEESKA